MVTLMPVRSCAWLPARHRAASEDRARPAPERWRRSWCSDQACWPRPAWPACSSRRHPWPNHLDASGYRLLPADPAAGWAHDLTRVGSLSGVVIGIVVLVVVGLTQDWVRAMVCAVAPVGAVLVVDQLAKPLINRHIDGVAGSYPSGTVTAVAALAAGAVLVSPRVVRAVTVVLAAALVVGISAAVVVLRWHYPTDALGGACVGIGAVFFLDGLAHLPWVIGERLNTLPHPHPREQRSARWT